MDERYWSRSSTLSGSFAGWWKFENKVVSHIKSTKVWFAKSALAVLLDKNWLNMGAAGKWQHWHYVFFIPPKSLAVLGGNRNMLNKRRHAN